MAQTWDVTLFTYVPAAGYGNTVSEGYGSASAAQSWDVLLLDGSAAGYGETVSSGYGAAESVGAAVWYDLTVAVLAEGATRPFDAPLDVAAVFAPLDEGAVYAPLDEGVVYAPLDVAAVFAPLDMETEV